MLRVVISRPSYEQVVREEGVVNMASLASDEHSERVCDLCQEDNNDFAATSYCSDCRQYLCAACSKVHRRIAGTSNHKLTDPDQTSQPDNQAPLPDTDTCLIHGDEELNYFCVDHDSPCCVICMFRSHRRCAEVKELSEMCVGVSQSDMCQRVTNELSKLIEEIDILKTETEHEWSSADDQTEAAMTVINDKKLSLCSHIELESAEAKKEVENYVDTVKTREHVCSDAIGVLQTRQTELQFSSENASEESLFITVNTLSQVCSQYRDMLPEILDSAVGASLRFEASDTVEQIINDFQDFSVQERGQSDGFRDLNLHHPVPSEAAAIGARQLLIRRSSPNDSHHGEVDRGESRPETSGEVDEVGVSEVREASTDSSEAQMMSTTTGHHGSTEVNREPDTGNNWCRIL